MDGTITVRYAAESDIEAIVPMMKEFVAFYDMKVDDAVLRNSVSYAIHHPGSIRFVVAEAPTGIAAIASLHLGHYSTFTNTFYAHVEDVYVSPPFRRQGIAQAMLNFMRDAARELGCSRLELHVLNDNKAARDMYEAFGFESIHSTVYVFHL
ncbi:MAG: N-acetyltransferase family protein [Ignavibacteriales bacterium]